MRWAGLLINPELAELPYTTATHPTLALELLGAMASCNIRDNS